MKSRCPVPCMIDLRGWYSSVFVRMYICNIHVTDRGHALTFHPSLCCESSETSPLYVCSESWDASQWRKIIRRAQQIAEGAGSKLPLLVGLDLVHGANYVEVHGSGSLGSG